MEAAGASHVGTCLTLVQASAPPLGTADRTHRRKDDQEAWGSGDPFELALANVGQMEQPVRPWHDREA